MSILEEILQYNEAFVESGAYRRFEAGKYPRKKLAVLSCMDTRLTELLPAALGLKNGDAKIIKNAGGMVTGVLDSTVRSLLIAVLELGVNTILVIGHTDCGVAGVRRDEICAKLIQRRISPETLRRLAGQGLDFDAWFSGFEQTGISVSDSVNLLRSHPLMPSDVAIHGFVMDIVTGELTLAKG